MSALILKRASLSRSGEWNEDDFDVLADGALSAASSTLTAAGRLALDVDAALRECWQLNRWPTLEPRHRPEMRLITEGPP